jgi:hypothetical protein
MQVAEDRKVRRFVLVHSPVVGPSTWRWVAEALVARGHTVRVPAVSPNVTRLGWQAFADAVAAQGDWEGQTVLVGHSGAGPLLPQIRARARREPGPLVFVDAGVPPETGEADLMPAELLSELRATAIDEMLPPWSDWFGPGVMDDLIPDGSKRAIVAAELPRLPVSYFEVPVPALAGWRSGGCGYIQLSEPYAAAAAVAARWGWPVIRSMGAHLDIVTRPAEVADAILAVTSLLGN